jgi:hypothetical protein
MKLLLARASSPGWNDTIDEKNNENDSELREFSLGTF